jgi:hypothetical protein
MRSCRARSVPRDSLIVAIHKPDLSTGVFLEGLLPSDGDVAESECSTAILASRRTRYFRRHSRARIGPVPHHRGQWHLLASNSEKTTAHKRIVETRGV